MIINGDSLEELKALPDCSVDSIVTDPPYGLGNTSSANVAECLRAWAAGETWQPKGAGFMGKSWDAWVPPPDLWREVLRVLKHGGHALVFAGSRTQDLMSISLRLAGFEVRDCLMWLYGSGFPKSHNISLAIDKAAGAEREVIGHQKMTGTARKTADGKAHGCAKAGLSVDRVETTIELTAPATEAAKQWQGWGTALKPAYEPIILARKPPQGSIANNTLLHGVGGLNIDGCRVETDDEPTINTKYIPNDKNKIYGQGMGGGVWNKHTQGRWPANILLDEIALKAMGSTGRYYFCAKASKAEREAGLEGFKGQVLNTLNGGTDGSLPKFATEERKNIHPTVKPLALMRYLCRLITPPDGTVLEPFAGSGTTLIAAHLEGFKFIGIERQAEYVEIIKARLDHWQGRDTEDIKPAQEEATSKQLRLFS